MDVFTSKLISITYWVVKVIGCWYQQVWHLGIKWVAQCGKSVILFATSTSDDKTLLLWPQFG